MTGPLTRRLQQSASSSGSSAERVAPAPASSYRAPVQADLRLATFSLLDGTVLARFQCHVDAGRLIIGRGSSAAIRVVDAYVHREHAAVVWDPGLQAHLLYHLGGSNGTWLNLERVNGTPVRLTSGARVRVGKTELIYHRVA